LCLENRLIYILIIHFPIVSLSMIFFITSYPIILLLIIYNYLRVILGSVPGILVCICRIKEI